VVTTNRASTREGIAHLIAQGHRRIGYLGHPAAGYGVPKRWEGYVAALRDAGLTLDPSVVRRELRTEADGARAASELLTSADPPSAIFTDNNRLTVGVLQSEVFAHNPVALMGFDSFELAAQFGVSVIDSDPFGVGKAGAELLFRRISERSGPPRRRVIHARLQTHSEAIYRGTPPR
jgi:LacI family transcriptional regulator